MGDIEDREYMQKACDAVDAPLIDMQAVSEVESDQANSIARRAKAWERLEWVKGVSLVEEGSQKDRSEGYRILDVALFKDIPTDTYEGLDESFGRIGHVLRPVEKHPNALGEHLAEAADGNGLTISENTDIYQSANPYL